LGSGGCGDEEQRRRGRGGRPDLNGPEPAGWQVTPRRAGVLRVEDAIGQPVHAHGEGAPADHRQRHPEEDRTAGPAIGREHHGHVGEGQGEDGVLELDGVEELTQRVHGSVTRTGVSGVALQSVLGPAPAHERADLLAHVVGAIQGLHAPSWLMLVAINIFLLIVACLIDPTSATLILTPPLVPIVRALGVDLIHFGIILTVNLPIGMFTPPFGLNLFVSQASFKAPMTRIARGLGPLIVIDVVALAIVT